ncbi:sulfite exporter TauE/SafE family protein [Pelagibius sp. Alg239-R121]|uniref:sulfite exporter TauE/SafE family protein n=1 Tax=Pelagibius sp. Alg239-R121 TaxID=2993448 RepID=UPI0024A6F2CA|nr:sulfite exporter TauE/SafE family protein [Pelagibius sp. Alg239-R121]
MIEDPLFYLLAVPALLIMGISKGGFGGGLGVAAVPLLSLAISPVQAAAVMLPILCFMDLFGFWSFRGKWDKANTKIIICGAVVGIAIGTASFKYLDEHMIKVLISVVALGFSGNYWLRRRSKDDEALTSSVLRGGFWSLIAGFTSFAAHAGGAPLNVYLLPLKLHKTVFQATTVIFFMVINYVKLIPYAWLGQLSSENLMTSLAILPLAIVGIVSGIWLHSRVPEKLFYSLCYGFLFLTGLKLLYDGVSGIL